MVPSWTETLIACDIPVVGRTRFCIHPEDKVKDIPIVGGTKNIDWDKVFEIKASVLLLDKEENPQEMAEGSPIPLITTHVTNMTSLASECTRLAEEFQSDKLKAIAARWTQIANRPNFSIQFFKQLPGVIEWIKKPSYDGDIKWLYYMIWKDPWMCVSKDTFIASVFEKLGLGFMIKKFDNKYPAIELESLKPKETLLLFSSEPYPFHKKKAELAKLGFSCAVVNGEFFSWFGIRSLNHLEEFFQSK